MTAPALIALAHGSTDPRSAATITALTEMVACMRPDLRVATAFLDHVGPSFDDVVDRLVAEGHQEIVVVPLLLSEAYHAKVDVPRAVTTASGRHDGVTIHATDVLGIEAAFFHVLDKRLREALSKNRVRDARRARARRRRVVRPARQRGDLPRRPRLGCAPQAADDRGVRVERPAGRR
jgi:sirohydrochlorin ferrochelatase